MTKDTFTAALKHAQEVQGAYKIEPSRRDALYTELAREGDKDVLDALKRIGRSDKTINYFNIKALIDENNPVNRYSRYKPPADAIPMPAGTRAELKKLFGKDWNK